MSEYNPDEEEIEPGTIERLKQRLRHYEKKLKNGDRGNHEEMARGISALCAAQEKTQDRLELLATREEVGKMITAHAEQCAAARNGGGVLELKRLGIRIPSSVLPIVAILLVVAIYVLGPSYVAREAKEGLAMAGMTNVVFTLSGQSRYDKANEVWYLNPLLPFKPQGGH